ncbi:hypothetical protein O181_052910 [Austropuccinia psidii MF-1]|uniref:Uncharacterized protein n=1 Tax=Austropuccinia psidii MF-1 TaxID=1389203 RepID=A0A9Q3DZP6_9BASI|nr:hypothetical protein [Austropuccinia psidii MF-1]
MPAQNSPPANNKRYQTNQIVLTPTARAPLDHKPSFHQLSENLDRGPRMEGEALLRRGGMKSRIFRSFYGLLGGYHGISKGPRRILGGAEDEEGEESVEEEESEQIKVAPSLEGSPEASEALNLVLSNQSLVSQPEPSFLKMEQITQFMGQLTQAVSPRDNYRAPAFKTPSMMAPNAFDGIQAHILRGFIQSCYLIIHNYPENFFSDRKKLLYSTSFLTGRDGKWIETYLSIIFNEDPSSLLNN